MALFTDGAATDLEGLLAYDSTVLEMARQEGVDLGVKLKLAWEELGIELTRFLVVAGKGDLGLRNISVTAPLEKCHAFRSLALAYSDAAHRQRNDRYRERAKEWERQAAWAWEALLDTGVGIVERPVEKASMPAVELVELRASAATYWVRIAWISSSGSEGAASEPSMVSASENQGLLVTARGAPEVAVGWNVYVGYAADKCGRQNVQPLRVGESWRQPAGDLAEGLPPGVGQSPDYHLRRGGMSSRGGGHGLDAPGLLLRG
jgi:hypothetical protein